MSLRLYDLLPEIYRAHDAKQGLPLLALTSVLQTQYDALERNMADLYAAWFIETCPGWTVPYIAALLGVEGLESEGANVPQQRARVANTQTYRAYKGAMAVLSHAAGEAAGWPAYASDNIDRLVTSQTLRAPRPGLGGSANLRDPGTATYIDTPFSRAARTAGFRDVGCGPYTLGAASIGFWRLQAYPIEGGAPHRLEGNLFTFHPMGVDTPLFTLPRTTTNVLRQPTPEEVPLRLGARRLAEMIARRRAGGAVATPFAIRVATATGWRTLPLEAIAVVDLGQEGISLPDRVRWGPRPEQVSLIEAGVDPERGRFMLKETATHIAVDYAYGFGLEIGGGPYERRHRMTALQPERWNAVVAQGAPAGPGVYPLLADALADWAASGMPGLIQLADSNTHVWPDKIDVGGRLLSIEAANGRRPCVTGGLTVLSQGADGDPAVPMRGDLVLSGLWMTETLTLQDGLNLVVRDCTLRPSDGGVALRRGPHTARPAPKVTLDRCIVAAPRQSLDVAWVSVTRSILDETGDPSAIADPRPNFANAVHATRIVPQVQSLAVEAAAEVAPDQVVRAAALSAAALGQPAYGRALTRREAAPGSEIGQPGAYYPNLQHQRLRNLDPVTDEFLSQQLTPYVYFAD